MGGLHGYKLASHTNRNNYRQPGVRSSSRFGKSVPNDQVIRKIKIPREPQPWGALHLFFVYRLALVTALLGVQLTGWGPDAIGSAFPQLFRAAAIAYLGFVLSSGLFLFWRSPEAEQQVQFSLFIDILTLTVLMHASGGVESGFGLLIAVSLAIGSLLMGGRLALLFAALATLAVLAQQVYAQLSGNFPIASYTQAGLLGVTFFSVALLAHVLSRRLQETERLATQRSLDLANMEQLNEYIIQHMRTGLIVVDPQARVRLMNESAWYLLGTPKVSTGDRLGQASAKLLALLRTWSENREPAAETFRPQPDATEVKAGFARLGTREHMGTLIFLEDSAKVTQQAQQMKLASLGRLAASIAHEIRNPLGAISHAGQLLAESPGLERGDRRLTEIIQTHSARLNEVVETVLQLSRRDNAHPETLPLKAWSEDFVTELARTRKLGPARMQLKIAPDAVRIRADPRHLRQILTNLCDNALQQQDQVEHPLQVRLSGGISPRQPAPFLDVVDNGPGIEPEVARQIFEPFFTTRNEGTGLGLYIAKELSETNQIRLEYLPVATGGSCFRLNFPNWQRKIPAP